MTKITLHVCGECGYVEGERTQPGCCPNCGYPSKPHAYEFPLPPSVARFRASIERSHA